MQDKYIKKRAKGKHLTLAERVKIEVYLKEGVTKKAISKKLGVSERTIYREINRGKITLRNSDYTERTEYAYDVAQRKYEINQMRKQGALKIGNNLELATYIERKVVKEKLSPYAALENAKKVFTNVNICLRTLYNYIHNGLFLTLSRKKLIYNKKKKNTVRESKRLPRQGGQSIEHRAEIINKRQELGHYEMDTVVSGKGSRGCLLVFTERVSRQEIIIKLKDRTSQSVIGAIKGLKERYKDKFNDIFKSITSDNGSEFSNARAIEEMGVSYFYAHSYCSYERGSNENNNKFIRRFIPKGSDIGKVSEKKLKEIERYMNNYPRKMFGGLSSNEVYMNLVKEQTY